MSGRGPRIVPSPIRMRARDVSTDAVGCSHHFVMSAPAFGKIRIQHRFRSQRVMHIAVNNWQFLPFGFFKRSCFCHFYVLLYPINLISRSGLPEMNLQRRDASTQFGIKFPRIFSQNLAGEGSG